MRPGMCWRLLRGVCTKGCSDHDQKRAGEEVDTGSEDVSGEFCSCGSTELVTPGHGVREGHMAGWPLTEVLAVHPQNRRQWKGGCGHSARGLGGCRGPTGLSVFGFSVSLAFSLFTSSFDLRTVEKRGFRLIPFIRYAGW